jgi:calcineurin-like phosphoesterase family protein
MPDLTYAIGDIHGCADLLERLLARIEQHRAGRDRCLVFLGDYVDRGPDSVRVIAILRGLQQREPEAVICLMGNHEEMMLASYRDGLGVTAWHENGGVATLASFGIEDPEDLPHDVLAWLSGLPTVHEDFRRYYVHAGFRPGQPGIDPDIETRLWIREPFLSADYDFGKHVVHGHTPQKSGRPDVRRHRTNLDTAAIRGGALTAGVFTGDAQRAVAFLQVAASD